MFNTIGYWRSKALLTMLVVALLGPGLAVRTAMVPYVDDASASPTRVGP